MDKYMEVVSYTEGFFFPAETGFFVHKLVLIAIFQKGICQQARTSALSTRDDRSARFFFVVNPDAT